MMRPRFARLSLLAVALSTGLAFGQIDPGLLKGMKWRNLGPFRGGRVTAVAGVVGQPGSFYMGLPQGGVWKTTSAGQTWEPVFDAIKETSIIGSIAVSASDPNTIYVGTGEIPQPSDGTGIYKSTDAGKTWTNVGLADSKVVPAILVDPKNPNNVLVAALGGRGKDSSRGVFRSSDGGKSWQKWSVTGNEAGVVSMASAFDHPEIVLAGTRNLGGSNGQSKLCKSNDFGKSWAAVEGKGLPNLRGRYTVAVAQNTNSQRMFVIGTFGLYRSDDGGTNWRRMAEGDQRIANGQGDYNCGVYVDTQNPDIVYTIATCLYRSTDGGNTFEGFKGAPGGDDPHFLWIDPTNANRMLYGGDQGATVSLDHGANWGSWYNQPSAQVYHIATDNRFPYWVYATQQDSGVIGTASRGNDGKIGTLDWTPHPGFEFGYVAIDPLNPNISYALSSTLSICRVQNPSGQWVEAGPSPEPGETFRQGFSQLSFNPTNPHELLSANQYLMSTTDGGQHWRKLSPDLGLRLIPSKDPKEKPTESKGFINSFAVSAADGNVIWAGTTNGLVQLTRDRGATWTAVRAGLPNSPRAGIGCIDASSLEPGTVYVQYAGAPAGSQLYRTRDFGQTWTAINNGLPKDEGINVVRCDTKKKGLLFAGTNKQVFASFDDGDHWQSLRLNLPTTTMNDLLIKNDDLVVGTYGRGFWVLDDIAPLRQIAASIATEPAHLFAPSVGYRVRANVNGDTPVPPEIPHAENPPTGVCLYYTLAAKPAGPVTIEIVDRKGNVVRHMTSTPPAPYADPKPEIAPYWIGKRQPLPTEVGLNRTNWDVRFDDPVAFVHDAQDVMQASVGGTPEAVPGPLAKPGRYTVRLTVDGKVFTQPLEIKNDPRSPASQRDLEQLHDVEMNLLACVNAGWDAHGQVVALRESLKPALASTAKDVAEAAKDLDEKLKSLQGKITYTRRFFLGANASNLVDLNIYLLVALGSFGTGDAAPSDAINGSYAACYYLTETLLNKCRELDGKSLDALNTLLKKNGLPTVAAVKLPGNPPLPIAKFRRKNGLPIGKKAQMVLPDDEERRGGDDDDHDRDHDGDSGNRQL